jgi:hypothetical protein
MSCCGGGGLLEVQTLPSSSIARGVVSARLIRDRFACSIRGCLIQKHASLGSSAPRDGDTRVSFVCLFDKQTNNPVVRHVRVLNNRVSTLSCSEAQAATSPPRLFSHARQRGARLSSTTTSATRVKVSTARFRAAPSSFPLQVANTFL